MNTNNYLMVLFISLGILGLKITNKNLEVLPEVNENIGKGNICYVIIQHPLCHSCIQSIDRKIKSIKDRNFKYYILMECDESVVNRKFKIYLMKNEINPDEYYFLKNEDFQDLLNKCQINYFPSIILNSGNSIKIIKYEEIFNDSIHNNINLDSILNILNSEK